MLLKKPLQALIAVTAFSLSGAAFAGDFYIGGGIYSPGIGYSNFEGSNTELSAFAGYTFIDSSLFMLSVEGGYYPLGSFKQSINGNTYKASTDALTLGGVAALPIGPFFEIYGKLGAAYMSIDSNLSSIDSSSSWQSYYGAGMSIDVLDTLDFYVEYLGFSGELDSNTVGLGVKLSF